MQYILPELSVYNAFSRILIRPFFFFPSSFAISTKSTAVHARGMIRILRLYSTGQGERWSPKWRHSIVLLLQSRLPSPSHYSSLSPSQYSSHNFKWHLTFRLYSALDTAHGKLHVAEISNADFSEMFGFIPQCSLPSSTGLDLVKKKKCSGFLGLFGSWKERKRHILLFRWSTA